MAQVILQYPASHHLWNHALHEKYSTYCNYRLFKDTQFANFRKILDGEMKSLQEKGIGTRKRQAEILTEAHEELLWEKGLLGDHSPQALLNTIFFMCGLFFALRSGNEHRQLWLNPPQITIQEQCEIPYIMYAEDVSKNHQGGLKNHKTTQKIVKQHSNMDTPSRCFVRIFKIYVSKLDPEAP